MIASDDISGRAALQISANTRAKQQHGFRFMDFDMESKDGNITSGNSTARIVTKRMSVWNREVSCQEKTMPEAAAFSQSGNM